MSRRLTRLSLLLVILLSSEVWALGLGDIKLDSALNEPLRADIVLLSATPDEIGDLKISLASEETFDRYGIDRPFFLQNLDFHVVNGGDAGSIVQVRSRSAVTEPFLTFLIEANWPSGRLLREYTLLLDPPTYAPPEIQETPAVTAPSRNAPTDSGHIERQASAPEPTYEPTPVAQPSQSAPEPEVRLAPEPKPMPPSGDVPYDSASGGDYTVEKSETLWGIASRMRPDSRLTMNQTMLAIYEANPDAFGGNINLLKEGASLRIPSADDIFRISRGDAFSEVVRQHDEWESNTPSDASSSPSLTLVPPDEEPIGAAYDDSPVADDPYAREFDIEDRIRELEAADVPDQQSLIEIRDNELAALRQQLADLRGEVYEPPVDELIADEIPTDDPFVDGADDSDVAIDDASSDADDVSVDTGVDDTAADIADDAAASVDDDTVPAEDVVQTDRSDDKGIVEKIIDFLSGMGGFIIGGLILVAGVIIWFMNRSGGDDDAAPWEALDSEEDAAVANMSATETMQVPPIDDAFVVVEQESGDDTVVEDTAERPLTEFVDAPELVVDEQTDDGAEERSDEFGSLEDTFSSETAINLDQTDPIAEADFHMAYGLYDQAADLINGALETDPSDTGLMAKLCEIYFVWGNRDAFVDAASNLHKAVGDGTSSEWDKIVIMGQQIAADNSMFAGAVLAVATKEVDLSFDDASDDGGGLDMDFGADDGSAADVIDLGADGGDSDDGIDFLFDETAANEADDIEPTEEMAAPTIETPTVEQPFEGFDNQTSELPSLDESQLAAADDHDGTVEINLDELDLDIDSLAETEIASLEDLDETGELAAISDAGAEDDLRDASEATGKNPEVDPEDTGVRDDIDIGLLGDLDATGELLQMPDDADHHDEPTDVGFDDSLLDATGQTQVLSEDESVAIEEGFTGNLNDDDATLLAPVEETDFEFAKTEALPADAFDVDTGETVESPTIAATDVDLDLDDLTAALKLSDVGDTVEQPRDDATVEQPRDDATVEQPRATMPGESDGSETVALAPEEMSGDLNDALTMTEVGTKLDLARAYVDMGDPDGARGILEEVLDEGDDAQRQQAQQLLDSLA